MRCHSLQHADADPGRRTESGAGRNLRSQEKIYRGLAAQFLQHGNGNLQWRAARAHAVNVLPGLKHPQIGRDDLDVAVCTLAYDGVKVFVDCRAQDRAAIGLKIGGQVGTSACKADPYGGSNYKHSTLSRRHSARELCGLKDCGLFGMVTNKVW